MPNFAKEKQSPKPKRFTTVRRQYIFYVFCPWTVSLFTRCPFIYGLNKKMKYYTNLRFVSQIIIILYLQLGTLQNSTLVRYPLESCFSKETCRVKLQLGNLQNPASVRNPLESLLSQEPFRILLQLGILQNPASVRNPVEYCFSKATFGILLYF